MNTLQKWTLLLIMMFTFIAPWVSAQEASQGDAGKSKWEFVVIPYFWMTGLNGDVTVKGITSHVDTPFSDILKNLDFGGQVHMEARKGRWGIFLDPTYIKLSAGGDAVLPTAGPLSADVKLEEWLVEFGGFYSFLKHPFGKEGRQFLTLDAIVGGRYFNFKTKMDLSAPLAAVFLSAEGSKDWIDPFLGARLRADLTDRVSLVLEGDMGGFGVGSDFTWNVSAIVGYHFSKTVSLWLGYRVLDVDYESGSGLSKLRYNMRTYGPMIGLGFHF